MKKLLKYIAKKFGYEILGPPLAYASQRSLIALLHQEKINLILDVGANTGQFVEEVRSAGYAARILSFEPLAAAHAALSTHAQRDPNWTVAERTAVGAAKGSIDIHVSANSVSSSALGMLPQHLEAAPSSSYIGKETVPLNRLDDLVALDPSDRILVKIDVQGFESHVLAGAAQILSVCRAVIIEMTLVPLYDGQPLAREIWDLLQAKGFEPWAFEPCYRNPQSLRMLQLDGVFVRKQPVSSALAGVQQSAEM